MYERHTTRKVEFRKWTQNPSTGRLCFKIVWNITFKLILKWPRLKKKHLKNAIFDLNEKALKTVKSIKSKIIQNRVRIKYIRYEYQTYRISGMIFKFFQPHVCTNVCRISGNFIIQLWCNQNCQPLTWTLRDSNALR